MLMVTPVCVENREKGFLRHLTICQFRHRSLLLFLFSIDVLSRLAKERSLRIVYVQLVGTDTDRRIQLVTQALSVLFENVNFSSLSHNISACIWYNEVLSCFTVLLKLVECISSLHREEKLQNVGSSPEREEVVNETACCH